jgi:hypothetical protein
MTGSTGGQSTGGVSPSVELLAHLHEIAVLGAGRTSLLRSEVSAEVSHVLWRKASSHAGHDGVHTLAALEFCELLGHVLGMLACEVRVDRDGAVAIHTVARGTGASERLPFRRVPLGGCRDWQAQGDNRNQSKRRRKTNHGVSSTHPYVHRCDLLQIRINPAHKVVDNQR